MAADSISCTEEFIAADGSYPFLREEAIAGSVESAIEASGIHITRLPVFDESNPDEDNALFRWANRFHVLTRASTVEQQLLFEAGDVIEPRLLDESARLLREQDYFYEADLRMISLCGTRARVEVITRDNWSLTPNLSFDRSGGENSFSVGLRDSNLLGLGKLLAVSRGEDLDRESTELLYEDPNVLGTRIRNRTVLIDSDDGSQQLFDLTLPFFSLDSRRSWAVRLNNETRLDTRYRLGVEESELQHEIESVQLQYGWSKGLQGDRFTRWSAGLQYQQDRFSETAGLPPPRQRPADRELVYPFLELEGGENRYVTGFNFDEIYRTEDLYTGRSLIARIGYASEALGSDQERIVVEGALGDTLVFTPRQLWQYRLSWNGLFNLENDSSEDVLINFSTRYFHRQSRRWSFFASLRGDYSINLSGERQILLGGDNGTRAFDNRFQSGDRSVVLSLEERLHTDIHLFNLLRVGAAVFVDAGRAWDPDLNSGLADPWLANVGLGLRLASSKAASSRIAHLDLAFPVTNRDHPAVDSVQIAFNIKSRF